MPVQHSIWKVGQDPEELTTSALASEADLEAMIVKRPEILSERWLIIGQQVHTSHGGFVDLLALDSNANLVVIELKRNQTPREVVAQALDYASWAQDLEPEEISRIYDRFSNGGSLDEAFQQFHGVELDEDQLNESHQIVVVASSLDPSTERIVSYLNDKDVAVNVIFFQVFELQGQKLLSRAWFIDPVETEVKATAGSGSSRAEWNGEYYVSFGHGLGRDWEEARKYGFISGGRRQLV